MELFPRHGQQLGVLAAHQRTDEVIRTVVHGFDIFFGVVALVEDQGDAFHAGSQQFMAFDQFLRQTGEGRTVGLVARISMMAQGDVKVRGGQQSQANDP